LCLQVLLGDFRIGGTERKIHAKTEACSEQNDTADQTFGNSGGENLDQMAKLKSQNGCWYNE